MKRYTATIVTVIEVTISDGVLALHKDAEWARDFYGLDTPEKIAAHLAYNVGLYDRDVSHLDGFADRSGADVSARVVQTNVEAEES